MAYTRRKIRDVHASASTGITTEALQRIGELYTIEAEVRGCSVKQRLAARKAKAAPQDHIHGLTGSNNLKRNLYFISLKL